MARARPMSFASVFTSGLFIALCAVALALETSLVTALPRQPFGFYAFVFFATWSAYRLHAIARAPRGRLDDRVDTLAILAATFVSAFWLRLDMLPWMAIAALLSISYSLPALPGGRRLREFGVLKILALTGVWTLVTAYLPVLGKLHGETLALLLARRFLFVFALCLAFDLRDHLRDASDGIRTVPVRIGVRPSYRLMRITLVGFAGMIVLGLFDGGPQPAGLVTAALLLSAVVTWAAIERSRRRTSSNLYYLSWIDGMMAAQGLMVAAATWISGRR